MSNPYFCFKQFTVHQELCAMKVSTDACIQGAWTPVHPAMNRVLDIGTGTGLLSLMVAQRLPGARIDAIELHPSAAIQAAENVAQSPFAARIRVAQADATAWSAPYRYDLIICNPPFFKDSLTGPDAARNAARHVHTLNAQTLVSVLRQHLSADGAASVMWPQQEHNAFAAHAAASEIHLQAMLRVRDKSGSRITRIVGVYGRQALVQPVTEELVIKNGDGSYTGPFAFLLSPFYLHL